MNFSSYSQLLPACIFLVRRFVREHAMFSAILAASAISFVASCIMFVSARTALLEAMRNDQTARAAVTVATKEPPRHTVEQDLLPFDSVELLDALQAASAVTEIPLQEVTFSLDDNASLPYLRYRASFTAAGNYSAIRRFVDRARGEARDVELDSVICRRKDIQDPIVACDLVFAAYYRRGQYE